MSGWAWFVVAWLALSGLAVFVRGLTGSVRRYTMADGIFAVIEVACLIWIVAVEL